MPWQQDLATLMQATDRSCCREDDWHDGMMIVGVQATILLVRIVPFQTVHWTR